MFLRERSGADAITNTRAHENKHTTKHAQRSDVHQKRRHKPLDAECLLDKKLLADIMASLKNLAQGMEVFS